ncbi:TolB family protein [Nonomuraea sp. NPDC050394]|uniref:TolB family protein n=1 Tax=Nonomuraea sp. NPDC050394 TaxID=3364363 RepID=UPI00379595A1
MTLEEELRSALGHAAERAPHAPQGLPAHIANRSRRRRIRANALMAAVAVVVIAGGAAVALRGEPRQHPIPAVRPTPTPSRITEAEPVEKVWPAAVTKIPGKLRGGAKIRPLKLIDGRSVLFETWESHEKANAIYAYDLEARTSRKITDIRTPKGVYADTWTISTDRVFWSTIEDGGTGLWSVPLAGGGTERLATVPGRVDAMAVAGDRLAFSVMDGGGVSTIPFGGGKVEAVRGAERHHILSWPWVGTPSEYTPNGETSYEEIVNAETGETSRAVVRAGETQVRCGVLTCVGVRPDRTAFMRLRDGTQERDLPEAPLLGLADDRFMTVQFDRAGGGQALLDLATGRTGDIGMRPGDDGGMPVIQLGPGDGRFVDYPLNGDHVIIDLSKIT